MSKFNTQEFKKLQSKWYKKLKNSGFDDIECHNADFLKQYHSYYYVTRYTIDSFKEKSDYYILATRFYNDAEFPNKVHKEIWGDYSKGLTYKKIAKKYKLSFSYIGYIVRMYSKRMLHESKNQTNEERGY